MRRLENLLAPSRRTLNRLLDQEAGARADEPFLVIDGNHLSVAELRARTARRAGALRASGVFPGDRVAVMAPNTFELVELIVGNAWNGSIAVPINIASRGAQLEYILRQTEPKAVAVASDLLEVLPAAMPYASHIWTLGSADSDGRADPLPQPGEEVDAHAAEPGDTLAILYTSGTTGPSKGVCCPHAQFYWWGVNTADALGIKQGDVLHTCLPLFHTNALNTIVQGLVGGARVTITGRFSASRFWSTAVESGATATYLLGAMATILARQDPGPSDRAHSVRVALAPGTPPPIWGVFEERFGIRLVEGHGMTETNFAIGPVDGAQRPGWMGRVRRGFEARVVDERDEPVADGVQGELVLRATEPFAFSTGYLNMPDETVRAWRNLWFHSGDRVVRDPDGWFQFVDRLKDAIRRRGENISAWEVEQVVETHPDVVAAAAVPVPSELGEDDVMVFVVSRNDFIDAADLLRHCEPLLAYFALPRYVEFVDELPLTANGKVQKAELRARGTSGLTWDRVQAGYEMQPR